MHLLSNINSETIHFNRQVNIKNSYSSSHSDSFSNSSLPSSYSSTSTNGYASLCDSIDCFLQRFKRKSSSYFDSFISREALLFKLELLSNISCVNFQQNFNLSLSDLKILKDFYLKKPFKVVELDKNIGAGLMSNDLYSSLANELLSDCKTYVKYDSNPLELCAISLCKLLTELNDLGYISDKLFSVLRSPLLEKTYKFGTFRFLPKLHKSKFSIRPIINYRQHLTSYLCTLIDHIIRPFVMSCDSYIKDSQDLINKTQYLRLPSNVNLFSCDFDSLYTNIVHSDCVYLICDFLQDKFSNDHLNIVAFKRFLLFVLDNNYFTFDNTVYKQNVGIAMGSVCGPSIANLFVYIYEKKWLSIHRPIVYYRFIDDLFIISLYNLNEMTSSLTGAFGKLTLNVDSSDLINFLDLYISIDNNNFLDFKLYFKPTNTFSYLLISSNHPSFMFKNIVKSLFIRIRRICTRFSNYVYYGSILTQQLLKRGYNLNIINKTFSMVSYLERSDLLIYKKRETLEFRDTFIFKFNFDSSILNFNSILSYSFTNLKNIFPSLNNKRILTVNKMQNNIFSLLVHNRKFAPNPKKCFFKKCLDTKCNVCFFSDTNYFIELKHNLCIPIQNFSNCNSEFVIYVIRCNLCSAFYIGQTKNIRKRIQSHISNIKTFSPYNDSNTCVSIHFNRTPHNFLHHFYFFVFSVDSIDNLNKRLNNEAFLINLFVKSGVTIINDYIPPIHSCRSCDF